MEILKNVTFTFFYVFQGDNDKFWLEAEKISKYANLSRDYLFLGRKHGPQTHKRYWGKIQRI